MPNPSALFLADARRRGRAGEEAAVAGAAVFAGIEGTRPVLVEIQALVAPSLLGTPRRAVVGWDATRLAMIMAVLDARCGLSVGANDIYLNVAGGLRIGEPAADLAVAAALLSALTETPGAGRHRRLRRDRPVRRGAPGRAMPRRGSRRRQSSAFAEAWVPRARPEEAPAAAPARRDRRSATVPIGASERAGRGWLAPRRDAVRPHRKADVDARYRARRQAGTQHRSA